LAKTPKVEVAEGFMSYSRTTAPEAVLWLAVIERAMLDYLQPSTKATRRYDQHLYWFFYGTTPEPCNLAHICDVILDYPGLLSRIRRRMTRLKNDAECKDQFMRSRRFSGYY
jgi:hypothetical protein